jgi:hypothetical protein
MPFTPEQMRTLVDGGGLAVELPATREGHRRFVTVGWHKLAMAGTPEFAAEPMTYVGLVYEIHESAMGVDLLRRKKSTSGRGLAGISPLARCFLT